MSNSEEEKQRIQEENDSEYRRELFRRLYARELLSPSGVPLKVCAFCRRGVVFVIDKGMWVLANGREPTPWVCAQASDGRHHE